MLVKSILVGYGYRNSFELKLPDLNSWINMSSL